MSAITCWSAAAAMTLRPPPSSASGCGGYGGLLVSHAATAVIVPAALSGGEFDPESLAMSSAPTPPLQRCRQAAQASTDAIEALEAVWERSRDALSPTVSTSQLRALHALEREEGINLRTLGEVLGSASPSMSRLCDRMKSLGLVERTPSPVSRRELELRLTAQGKFYLQDLRKQREQALTEMLDAMSFAEREELVKGLKGMKNALEAAGAQEAAESARRCGPPLSAPYTG
ncbi:MarR family winged helix-turn-helix transcriptional regulator [Streptomyces sp. NPDC093795]|uniref:MarR family winged helix-turn-helix transcriptional regulator n=1 Tax=Streptomyces sp. NPDC093795 TaxID=3366051 RepID=UPI00380ED756